MNTSSENPSLSATKAVSRGGIFSLIILAGIALSVAAVAVTKIAPEQGYTVPPGVATPIVMKTLPDAACDLHMVGISAAGRALRINANGDGYFKIHLTPPATAEGEHMQIDCKSEGQAATYLLYVRAGDAPTLDMPAPQTVIPPASGSKGLPALAQGEAPRQSREDLLARDRHNFH